MSNDYGSLAASLISGLSSYYGQKSANESNLQISRETNLWNTQMARETNLANAQQVRALMDYQTQMSNTAYQRQMADMRKAGLNPMLAANMGGSSTPLGGSIPNTVGAGAVTGAAQQNEMVGIPAAVMSAFELKRMKATIDNIVENTRKTMSDIDLNNVVKASTLAETSLRENNAKVAKVNAENMKLLQPGLKAEANIDEGTFGKAMRAINRAAPVVNSAVSVKRAFK